MSLKKLLSILILSSFPSCAMGYNYESHLKLTSRGVGGVEGKITWRSFNKKLTFSGKLNKFLGKEFEKNFNGSSEDNMFILNGDTLYTGSSCSDLLKVIDDGLKTIDSRKENQEPESWENKSVIITKYGKCKILTKCQNNTLKITPINCRFLINGLVEKLTIYTNYSTGGYSIPTGGIVNNRIIGDIKLSFQGYMPLNKKGGPVFSFDEQDKQVKLDK